LLHLADSPIADTAKAHNLTLITRYVDDFSGMDVNIIIPWKKSPIDSAASQSVKNYSSDSLNYKVS